MNGFRWRTVDIVVASTIAVAFGVIFWAWGLLWFGPFSVAFSGFPPAAGIVNGVWFIPAVLAPLIIRKPGAALFAELVAAIISMLLGSGWGWLLFWYGAVQGLGGELAFAPIGPARFGLARATLAGALAGAGATALDLTTSSLGDMQTSWQIAYGACQIASGALIAGVGSYLLAKGLARTGVLDRFPIGRVRELV
ncbi:ABC transporter permease [Rhizocola hellebori]|uniref:ABC transporter permease n=1 Tax=Rhizocola hellebori TaxID=1392758 RepID=A0A8J3Q3Q4_9ACTN|nr:ECF transporter S component [Rhizocola hellebori]GIH03179.1 ABC transporter permease [Rhizocola hellebori]